MRARMHSWLYLASDCWCNRILFGWGGTSLQPRLQLDELKERVRHQALHMIGHCICAGRMMAGTTGTHLPGCRHR